MAMFQLPETARHRMMIEVASEGTAAGVLKILLRASDPIRRVISELMANGTVNDFPEWMEVAVPTMQLAEERDTIREMQEGRRCISYVFNERKKEQWDARKGTPLGEAVRQNTRPFLQRMGYELVKDAPKNGDVIAYGNHLLHDDDSEVFLHFGLYNRRGIVTSKWGEAHVFRHGIPDIGFIYGHEAVFFRKTGKPRPVL
jgi:hypothetical protein